ncbi:hypothetical protein AB8O64_36175 (plasmid) [Streptomyces sp. QH1-20]|uniref:hypothetical protein n=1 Tax=Streptomyces sp. QH1-20 TaxID=3240934 RepID=UPI003512415D
MSIFALEYPADAEITCPKANGEPPVKLDVTFVRPGIAVLNQYVESLYQYFAPAFLSLEAGHPRLSEDDFLDEMTRLIKRLEAKPVGRRLIKSFGDMLAFPDARDGTFGEPDPDGFNGRQCVALLDRERVEVPVRVLIAPSRGFSAVCIAGMRLEPLAVHTIYSMNGWGVSSLVLSDPRYFLLVDDRILPPELLLAHELIHAAHNLAGAYSWIPPDPREQAAKNRGDLDMQAAVRSLASTEAAALMGIDLRDLAKLRDREEDRYERFKALRDQTLRQMLTCMAFPVPVTEPGAPEAGYVVTGGISMEEHETHGNPATLEWFRRVGEVEPGVKRFMKRGRFQEQSVAIAQVFLDQTISHGEAPYPGWPTVEDIERCIVGRAALNGITEVAIAKEMGFSTRISYAPITRCSTTVYSPAPRREVSSAWKKATTPADRLNALKANFDGGDPVSKKAVKKIEQHLTCFERGGDGDNVYARQLCTDFTADGALIPAEDQAVPFTKRLLPPGLQELAERQLREVGPQNNPAEFAAPSAPSYVSSGS